MVIPTYNRAALLRRTLETLVAQRFPVESFEVVIADDGSSDDTAGVVAEYATRLRTRYHFQEDLGFRAGAARNAGARLATAPVVAFLDDGALANPDYVHAHVDAHRDRAAVMGYVHGYAPLGESRSLDDAVMRLDPVTIVERLADDRTFFDSRHYEFEFVDFDVGRMAAPWYLFWSGNISMRVEDFWAVGGFDEDFHSWGTEDIELGYRVTEHGIPIVLSRDAWSVELPHGRDANNVVTSMANMQLFLDKHRTPIVELCAFILLTRYPMMVEDAGHRLLSWARRSRRVDVLGELETVGSDVPRRVAVFGCGGSVPASWAADGSVYTLLDFDRDLLCRAVRPGHTGRYGIGLRTGLPDKSFDLVVITSRLRGLWELWGKNLLQEAQRVGHEVRVPFRGIR
ncbi:hypothetical protein Vau01_118150 [Virgisporangium aurantiacum]|uniref:Glycosyltransferase n=1 Tax=Virgisporangium aurantiacum TaxID=175570 RepID=A0A8J4E7H2_9ACTN|nr:hypothetical protein Vau01_118150 [Virgisporangium aurantiacum]